MVIPKYSKSNSPRKRQREGLFSLVTANWSLSTVLIALLLSAGCADETINNPIADKPVEDRQPDVIVSTNYFPMTVGSRWVYRNRDGSEWSREVTESEDVGSRSYHYFSYNPPIEGSQIDFFRSPMYIADPDSLFLKVTNSNINDAMWETIHESNDNSPSWVWIQKFQNGEWQTRKKGLTFLNLYNARGVLHSHLVSLIRVPLVPGQTWKMLSIRFNGSADIRLMSHSFVTDLTILGTVGHPHSVPTPAGLFEDCLNIQFKVKPPSVRSKAFLDRTESPENVKLKRRKHMETEFRNELTTLLTHVIPKLGLESAWLAPGVGPVRIESAEGTAVLIDYEIKAVDL